ncbi:MAG: DUF4143 domain-containing protein, partial [Phycisphaerae bacterium]
VLADVGLASHYGSADEPALKDRVWIEQQWEAARALTRSGGQPAPAVLALDEIQKIPGWSETVKRLWDEDAGRRLPLHVVVLGSSPMLVRGGLSDSLTGRFEIIPVTHWSYGEMEAAFGWTVEQYVYYGGYPGAAPLIDEPPRWRAYVLDSLIETTISRDVLLVNRVHRPALLRRLFELGCLYSGRVLSYSKMLGQLQDAGNTTTLAHYLELLRGCGLLEGLCKYAGQNARRRASSPKLQVHNNALISAQGDLTFEEALNAPDRWGRLVESAVGAHLVNAATGTPARVYYWAAGNREVDFVLAEGRKVVAIEVKSALRRSSLPGIEAFAKEFGVHRKLLVGAQGIGLRDFLQAGIEEWL